MLGRVQCTRDTKTKGVALVHRVFTSTGVGHIKAMGGRARGRGLGEGVYHILPFFP